MKNMKLLIGMTLILMCQGVQAQDASLVKEGKQWEYISGDVAPTFHYLYTIQGDSVISGKTYKKMYKSKDKGVAQYVSAFREEDGKVFKLHKGSDEEYMLYDFNAEVGAVVYHQANDIADIYLTVRDIDHVPVGDEERKRMILTMTEILNGGTEKHEYPDNVVWVEGIGSIGLFDSPETAFVSGGSGWLLGCFEDGSKVFSQENFYPEREIPYENLTIDEARNTFGMVTCRLALDGSKVEMCDGECLVLADSNSGNHVRLFGMGCEFAEGTELGGYIAGLLCSWNDMMTLFPTRSTDISEILSSDDGIRGFGSAEKMHNSLIFDIEGKTFGNLPTNRKKYIYISNRKKYLWNKE